MFITPWNISFYYKKDGKGYVNITNLALTDLRDTLLKVKEENKGKKDIKAASPITPLIKEYTLDKALYDEMLDKTSLITIESKNSFFTRKKE